MFNQINGLTAYLFLALLMCVASSQAWGQTDYEVNLEDALNIAFQNNDSRIFSQQSLEIAEAQYKQALSAYYPKVDLNAKLTRLDEDPTFSVDGIAFSIPTPLGVIPAQVPSFEVPLFDRDTGTFSLELTYPLYTGGLRTAIREQARVGVDIAKVEMQRTDLQLKYDVERYFYAALLTQKLADITEESVLTLQTARNITKAFMDGGSTSVNQRDYLQSELSVAIAESFLAEVVANNKSALEALKFAMGVNVGAELIIKPDSELPTPNEIDAIDTLIDQAKNFNPDINTLHLAVQATTAKIKEARSGHLPKVAFLSRATHFENSLDSGLTNSSNSTGWSIGIGMTLPLFEGFRTTQAVSEAKARNQQFKTQKVFVERGIASQIKNNLIELDRSKNVIEATEKAVGFSAKHKSLTRRAYKAGLVETKSLIEAVLYDSVVQANYVRARHDIALQTAGLNNLIGKQIEH